MVGSVEPRGASPSPDRSSSRLSPRPSRSPSRRPGGRGRGGRAESRHPREVVVERVIRDTGSTKWPQLTRTNYDSWSAMMKLKLEARCLWDIVEHGADE